MFSSIGYAICIPFAWLLRVLYSVTSSYGVAIILFTLVIKLVMLPFQMKSKKSMMRMSRMSISIQPSMPLRISGFSPAIFTREIWP